MIAQTRTPADRQVPLAFVLFTAVLVLAGGLLVRYVAAQRAGLTLEDLHRYEQSLYGVDLPDWYGRYPFLLDWTRGDGQAFVTLANDLDLEAAALNLPDPSYRFIRVGYSWLGRAIVGGAADLVPIGLFAASALSLIGIGTLTARLTGQLGPRALLLVANPAIFIGIKSDTPETVGVFLLLLAVTARRRWLAVASAALLGTVRPSYMTALFIRREEPLWPAVSGFLAASILRISAALILPPSGSLTGGNITWPFLGYFSALPRMHAADAAIIFLVLAAGVAAVYVGLRGRYRGSRRIGWLSTGALTIMLAPQVVDKAVNGLRAAGALPIVWVLGTGPDEALRSSQE